MKKALAKFATFETERLILRPFAYSDWQDFYQIVSNPENLSFIFPYQASKEEAQNLLVSLFMEQPLGKWAIVEKESQAVIGAIAFEKWLAETAQAEIGYFIRKDRWQKGYATEALQNLVYLSTYALALSELVIVAHAENTASQRVAEKAGFQLFRQYKGSDRYTHKMRLYKQYLLKTEWIFQK